MEKGNLQKRKIHLSNQAKLPFNPKGNSVSPRLCFTKAAGEMSKTDKTHLAKLKGKPMQTLFHGCQPGSAHQISKKNSFFL